MNWRWWRSNENQEGKKKIIVKAERKQGHIVCVWTQQMLSQRQEHSFLQVCSSDIPSFPFSTFLPIILPVGKVTSECKAIKQVIFFELNLLIHLFLIKSQKKLLTLTDMCSAVLTDFTVEQWKNFFLLSGINYAEKIKLLAKPVNQENYQ